MWAHVQQHCSTYIELYGDFKTYDVGFDIFDLIGLDSCVARSDAIIACEITVNTLSDSRDHYYERGDIS